MVAKEIGIDLFDDTTYEASRLMYWPSTSSNGEFFYKVQDGAELDPVSTFPTTMIGTTPPPGRFPAASPR